MPAKHNLEVLPRKKGKASMTGSAATYVCLARTNLARFLEAQHTRLAKDKGIFPAKLSEGYDLLSVKYPQQ